MPLKLSKAGKSEKGFTLIEVLISLVLSAQVIHCFRSKLLPYKNGS